MMKLTAALAIVASSLVATGTAQSCGSNCLSQGIAASGCAQTDVACICDNQQLIASLPCCIASCSAAEQQALVGQARTFCPSLPADLSCKAGTASSESPASITDTGAASTPNEPASPSSPTPAAAPAASSVMNNPGTIGNPLASALVSGLEVASAVAASIAATKKPAVVPSATKNPSTTSATGSAPYAMGNETSTVMMTATATISCASSTAPGSSAPAPFKGDAARATTGWGFAVVVVGIVAGMGIIL